MGSLHQSVLVGTSPFTSPLLGNIAWKTQLKYDFNLQIENYIENLGTKQPSFVDALSIQTTESKMDTEAPLRPNSLSGTD